MKLDLVTMTGADITTHPKDLLELSNKYPFVEWGILISKNRSSINVPRYPSIEWVKNYLFEFNQKGLDKLSCHICGSWVRDLLKGDDTVFQEMPFLLDIFNRFQLNFHAEKVSCDLGAFINLLNKYPTKHFIFQIDGENGNKIFDEVLKTNSPGRNFDAYPLFDISGGQGILPDEWPSFIKSAGYNGYAGGLGPENLREQLEKIQDTVDEDDRIWIDMETKVRSNNDFTFDLEKVEKCLKIAKDFM